MTDLSNSRELDRLLARYADEIASPQDIAALEKILRSDDDALTRYVYYLDLCATLEAERGEALPGEVADETPQAIPGHVRLSFLTRFDWQVHPFTFLGVVLTITGVFWMLVFSLFWSHAWSPDVAQEKIDPNAPIVATFVDEQDVDWDCDPADKPTLGVPFNQGEIVKLKSGLIKIRFISGAKVSLEGPCEFTFTDENIGNLHVGKLVADVPERAKGFAVTTPGARFVDLGTNFGVEVDPQGDTHMQVYQGVVEVRPDVGETHMLAAGEAVQVDSQGDVALKPFDKKRFNQEPPKIAPSLEQGIARITGSIRLLSSPPGSVVKNEQEDFNNIIIFRERQGVLLKHNIQVDAVGPGSGEIEKHVRGKVSAGKRVDSYLVHFEPGATTEPGETRRSGTITFDRPVLGIIALMPGLAQTDDILGAKETRYGKDTKRALTTGIQQDQIELSADRRTIHISWATAGSQDQMRVLVATGGN